MVTELNRKILKYHLKVMLPQGEGITLLDSGQRWGWYPIKSQGISNRTKMTTIGALKQHSDNTFLAPLTCFSGGELLCLICGNSGPHNKKNPFPTRKDRRERAETYSCPLTAWFQVARKSKWWGTLKCSLQLKYSGYCFHSHPYRHITTYVFLNLTLQHTEKVLVLLWKNSAARNRTLVRFGLFSRHQ